ncbi:MAG: hypothetical protein ACHQF2_01395 [Flavobacteriales bacterium]
MQSCDISHYYFKKRIHHSYSQKKEKTDTISRIEKSARFPENKPLYSSQLPVDSFSFKPDLTGPLGPELTQVEQRRTVAHIKAEKSIACFIKKNTIHPAYHRKPSDATSGGLAFLFTLIILGILVLAGFGMYWVGVWAFGLTLLLVYQILLFILAVTLVSVIMSCLLLLVFMIVYSIGHGAYRPVPAYIK